jgi:hypothetical protein
MPSSSRFVGKVDERRDFYTNGAREVHRFSMVFVYSISEIFNDIQLMIG